MRSLDQEDQRRKLLCLHQALSSDWHEYRWIVIEVFGRFSGKDCADLAFFFQDYGHGSPKQLQPKAGLTTVTQDWSVGYAIAKRHGGEEDGCMPDQLRTVGPVYVSRFIALVISLRRIALKIRSPVKDDSIFLRKIVRCKSSMQTTIQTAELGRRSL